MKRTKRIEKEIKVNDSNKFSDINLYLAPMAGYTDLPFRLLAQEYGADYTTSEMVSAKGLYYKDKKTFDLIKTDKIEKNFGIQIFGSEPEILKSVVDKLEVKRKDGQIQYKFLEFNVGCPAPKIVKNGDGSALLKNLDLLGQCVSAIRSVSEVPLSVKTRTGFSLNQNIGLEIAQVIEDNGADRIVIHPRSREQFYSGKANWDIAESILNKVNIPVVLSGDISSPEKAQEAINRGFTNLMIGRSAVDNPMIFKQIKDFLRFNDYNELTIDDRIEFTLKHIKLAQEFNNTDHMIVALRKQLAAYSKGLPKASLLRKEIFKATKSKEIISLFNSIKEDV